MMVHIRVIAAGGVALAACGLANAQAVFSTNLLTNNIDESDDLIVFDPLNPAGFSVIGSTGVADIGFGGLDFDADGNLWGYATLFKPTGGSATRLYNFDTSTGTATPIGSSLQALQDLAYNPVDGKMYGINTRGGSETKLFEVNLATGVTTDLGVVTGLPSQHFINGLAIDSNGDFFVHDVVEDIIFKSTDSSSFSPLFDLPQDTNFGQGMTIDWSRDDTGYHGAVGFGVFPDFFSQVNVFAPDGSSYVLGPSFGPNDSDGLPPVQPGDLAIAPVPAPGVLSALLASGLLVPRRRR